jgi:drug/metabolite transporter, DME family
MTDVARTSTTTTHVPLGASLLAFGAGLVWSLGALAARLAGETDAWQYLIWRSVGILVVMEVISARRRQGPMVRRAFTSGAPMLLGNVSLLVASVAFVYALKNTTAANAAFLASVTPLIAVVFARIFIGERLTRVTIGAIGLALSGLLIMVTADLGAGNMAGNVAAIMSSVGFAAYTVCIRSDPDRDWSPVLPGYATMMIVLCVVVSVINGKTLLPPLGDVSLALLHGGVFIVVGTIVYNIASRTVPAVAMTVFAQSETVFVPVWIFLWFGERPKAVTLLGAAVILLAVVGKAVLDSRPPRLPEPHQLPDVGPGSIA